MAWRSGLGRGIAGVLLVCVLIGARAEDGTLSLLIENDSISHTDRYYTHGIRLGWLSAPDADRACGDRYARWIPFLECRSDARWVLALSQMAFSPIDLNRTVPDPADRPYAGWLNVSAGVVARIDATLDQLALSVGMVGPASQGEGAQKLIHRVHGIREPRGWDYQLHNELAIQGFYQRSARAWRVGSNSGFGADVLPHYGGALGNVYIYANTGGMLRVGKNLSEDFGPPRIEPGVPGSDYANRKQHFAWYLFAGVDGRAVAHNIFLDGNTFRDSPSVERNVWVADLQVGLMIDWDPIRIGYTHVWRSREFRGQPTPQAFGAVSIAYRF